VSEHERSHRQINGVNVRSCEAVRSVELEDATSLALGARSLQYGIAVVTAGHSVYAINTASGRTQRVAVTPLAVRAQIEPIGIVYAYSTKTRGTAKLIPMSRVESVLR
jgi:hypothetical protein